MLWCGVQIRIAAVLASLLTGPIAHANNRPGVPGESVLLSVVSNPCDAPWLPGLAGPWVVGCGEDGDADRALSLISGTVVDLPDGLDRPSLGPGILLQQEALRPRGMLVILEEGATAPVVQEVAMPLGALAARPMTDGDHVVVLTENSVQAYDASAQVRKSHIVEPLGWYPPALAWPSVAWVAPDEDFGEDIWWLPDATSDKPQLLAGQPGHRTHVVGHDRWLAWLDNGNVWVMDPRVENSTKVYPADTGFSAPPSLWRDVACWETRTGPDVDIECSDGIKIQAPGHQQWPGRWDRWLVYREGNEVHLFTVPEPALPASPSPSTPSLSIQGADPQKWDSQ